MSGSKMRIGELARATELTNKTIRYYEDKGLLNPAPRTESGYREYGAKDVERLEFIKKAKRLGLSLDEIRDILNIHKQQQAPCAHVMALLDQKLDQANAVIAELSKFREEMTALRDESRARLEQLPEESRVCGIIERGIHARGETAMAWLEARAHESRQHH